MSASVSPRPILNLEANSGVKLICIGQRSGSSWFRAISTRSRCFIAWYLLQPSPQDRLQGHRDDNNQPVEQLCPEASQPNGNGSGLNGADNETRDKIIWNLYSVHHYSYNEIAQLLSKINPEWSYMNYDSIRKVIFREKKLLKEVEGIKQSGVVTV